MGLLGERLSRISYFLLGAAIGFGVFAVVTTALLLRFSVGTSPDDTFYIALGVAMALAIILGLLLSCIMTVGITLVGLAFGFYLGILLYQFGTVHIDTSTWEEYQVNLLIYLPAAILAILFAVLVHKVCLRNQILFDIILLT